MRCWFDRMSTNTSPSTWSRWCVVLLFSIVTSPLSASSAVDTPLPEELPVSTAQIVLTFTDPVTGKASSESQYGQYAVASPISREYGKVVHVLAEDGTNHGCQPVVNAPQERWIALIQRGKCKFHDKILNAVISNASAVIVYNSVSEEHLLVMNHFIDYVVSVFVHQQHGERIASLVDGGVVVHANISLEGVTVYDMRESVTGRSTEPYKVQPLLIISVSLIAFLITGLSALLIYGIRRTKRQRRKAKRHIVFTVNEAQHQRLLLTDLPETIVEPNNNDPNHNLYTSHYWQQ